MSTFDPILSLTSVGSTLSLRGFFPSLTVVVVKVSYGYVTPLTTHPLFNEPLDGSVGLDVLGPDGDHLRVVRPRFY